MGTSKRYLASGGFTEQEYEQLGTTANGIKIIGKIGANESKTPMFSNTPNTVYAKVGSTSGKVNQLSFYSNGSERRAKSKDIDAEHSHVNKENGRKFNEADIHVHDYDENGVRSKEARKPSKKERRLFMIARYRKRQDK